MGSTGVIDQFLGTFTRYIDSGFGLLGGEVAFIAIDDQPGELAGIVRYGCDAGHKVAEFAELVRSDLQGAGLGIALMRLLIDYARADRLDRLDGLILRENQRMQAVCRELGFIVQPVHDDPTLVRASLIL